MNVNQTKNSYLLSNYQTYWKNATQMQVHKKLKLKETAIWGTSAYFVNGLPNFPKSNNIPTYSKNGSTNTCTHYKHIIILSPHAVCSTKTAQRNYIVYNVLEHSEPILHAGTENTETM
jgi:hypothetical protein